MRLSAVTTRTASLFGFRAKSKGTLCTDKRWENWWSFDHYIAGEVAEAMDNFIHRGNGYPSDVTETEFYDRCVSIRDPLIEYHWEWDFNGVALEHATMAMHRFAENFGDWWD